MATISKLVVSLSANSAKLVSELKKARGRLAVFASDVTKKAKAMRNTFKTIASGVGAITKAAAAGAATVTGFFAAIAIRAGTIKDIKTLSSALDVSSQALQEWIVGGAKVGLQADKIGDIFKDVQEKISDFLTTGGGEAADLFENLSLKASDFIGLAPDQAILKIGDALSGLTRGQQIFFMESLANDASRLLPLLDNNAEALKRFAAEGRRSGQVLTDSQIEIAASFADSVSDMTAKAKGFWSLTTVYLSGPFEVMVKWINTAVEKMGGIDVVAKGFANAIISSMIGAVKSIGAVVNELDKLLLKYYEAVLLKEQASKFLSPVVRSLGSNTATGRDAKIDDLKLKISGIESGAQNMSSTLDALEKLKEELKAATDATEIGAESQRNLTNTTDPTAAAVSGLGKAAEKARQFLDGIGGDGKKSDLFEKLFPDKNKDKRVVDSQQFNNYARAAMARAKEGNGLEFDKALSRARDVADRIGRNKDFNYDRKGIEDVIKRLSLAGAGLSRVEQKGSGFMKTGSNLVSAQPLTNMGTVEFIVGGEKQKLSGTPEEIKKLMTSLLTTEASTVAVK